MKLYNSETRQIEEFVPNDPNQVTIYTCGPTVYHFAHIGNLRSYICEDILHKGLEFLGYNVKRAMNITDVGHLSSDGDEGEDKMLLGAEREHRGVLDIAKEYTEAFKNDFKSLKLLWPEIVVPATSCVADYQKMIGALLEKGYAYISQGNVYFDTSKLQSYYRFGNQGASDLAVAVRDDVSVDDNKRNKNDFVLWFTKSKFSNHALKWDSPWGTGYPGWHIECSGISLKYLGEKLDIHCGGVDNKFPHHTNEIAQTESVVGHKWCNYWFHVEHLNTKAGKMSKSTGDFLTLSRLNELGFSPMVYKFFCLQSHYRKQLVFSTEALEMAKNAYEKLCKKIATLTDDGAVEQQGFDTLTQKFKDAIANDLNTSLAITVLFDTLKAPVSGATKRALIKSFDTVLGLGFTEILNGESQVTAKPEAQTFACELTEAEIVEAIEKRRQAKANKDYATADQIRNDLLSKGIELVDTKDGTTYKIK